MTTFEPVRAGLKWAVSYQCEGCAPSITIVSFWWRRNAMQMCHVLAAAYEDGISRGAAGAVQLMISKGYRVRDCE